MSKLINEIVFFVLALIIIVGSLKMLLAAELMHSAVYLGLVLAGVAGIYLTLSAELLAAVQILIYVGAVLTLMLFAIMFTQQGSPTEGYGEDRTPLSMLGVSSPVGIDVESMAEAPEEATTVREAEAATQAPLPETDGSPAEEAEPEEADDEPASDEASDDTKQEEGA